MASRGRCLQYLSKTKNAGRRASEDAERDFVEALTLLKRRVAYSKSASGTAAVRLVACSNSALASL